MVFFDTSIRISNLTVESAIPILNIKNAEAHFTEKIEMA
jgi:hypothetical protein